MRLTTFSVSRFRSIIDAEKISIGDTTTLLGRNNEGKSNILKALSHAIESIRIYSASSGTRVIRSFRSGPTTRRTMTGYDWERDFPVQLQRAERGSQKTRFRLDFELSEAENQQFLALIGSNINGQLPVEIQIGPTAETEIVFLKQGRAFKKYQENARSICEFISQHVDFIYVPAVRTEKDALDVIRSRFRRLLGSLEDNPEYKAALQAIQTIQKPLLDKLASDVEDQLRRFIPTVQRVSIDTSEQRILNSVSSEIEVMVNDGVETSLEAKGDGIKSLVALSLFQSSSAISKSRIIAIEEPESHLHPGAVHELRRVLDGLAVDGQVIVSTHSAAFANRQRLSDVVLVEGGKAARVKGIDEVRRSLGILISDNLMNADFSIVCEGSTDARILSSILSASSQKLRSAISGGELIFDALSGSSKLAYKLSSLNRDVFNSYAILDFDAAGRDAVSDSIAKGLLTVSDYSLIRVRGAMDSEIEDMFRLELLRGPMMLHFGLDIGTKPFGGKAKFSDRMKAGFETAGKLWDTSVEGQVKAVVANELESKPLDKLTDNALALIATIVASLETKLAAL